jgi:uncharacterized protein with GYD domain
MIGSRLLVKQEEVIWFIFHKFDKMEEAPTKNIVDSTTNPLKELEKQGIKMRVYWTLRRYDAVTFVEPKREGRHASATSFSRHS